MTMDIPLDEAEFLTERVIAAKEPVTYHTFSKERNLHHDQAKQILYEFYKSNRDQVTGSFIITGTSNENTTLIKLSENEAQLAENVKLFSAINTIHIYCIHIKDIDKTNEEISFLELKHLIDHNNLDPSYKNGLVKGPELVVVKSEPRRMKSNTPSTTPSTSNTPTKSNDKETKPKKTTGLTSGYVSRKQQQNEAKQTSKRPQTDILAMYTSRKGESNKDNQTKRAATTSSGYQYKSRKLENQPSKERVVVSNVDDNDDMEVDDVKPKTQPKTNLQELFLDDDFEFSDDDASNDKNEEHEKQPKESEKEPEKEPEEELGATEKDIPEQDKEPSELQNDEAVEPEREAGSSEKQESEEPETIVDEDGYITSYRKKPEPSKPKPTLAKPEPAKKPSNNSNKKAASNSKKQSSLMNFFQKR